MKKIVIGISVVVTLLVAFLLFSAPSEDNSNKPEMVNSLQDAHGLAVDRKNSSKVYIATHTGLLVMNNDGEFQRAGTALDDYMGFSAHPSDPNTFYSSGHPSRGGNIGFQKSTDGGRTWQKVSNGVAGPVDFHAMTVSQADQNTIYGWYRGQLQRSSDEGKNWQVAPSNIANVIVLATSPTANNTVYAGTVNGLQLSHNQGNTWSGLNLGGVVTALAVDPTSEQELVAYSDGQGLVLSKDSGSTWKKLSSYSGGMVMHLAYDVQNPTNMYLINQNLEIHKTTDGGETWKKVR